MTKQLTDFIRTIPDYPKKGILFRDITSLLNNPEGLKMAIDQLAERYKGQKIDHIAAIDSRGFLFAAPLAYLTGAGLVLIRKKGKLPREVFSEDYDLEYGSNTLEIHTDDIRPGDRVLLVDDLIATGGSAEAAVKLIRRCGGDVVECVFIIELPDLKGKERLTAIGCPTYTLCQFEGD